MTFSGKNVLVTGASTGIGQAIAIEFAKTGAHVILTGRKQVSLKTTSDLIKQVNGTCEIVLVDFNITDEIERLISQVRSRGNLFALINVAAVWHTDTKVLAGTDYHDFSQDEIILTMNVGILAPMLLVHGLLPIMSPGSKIINISGTFDNGAKGWVPYYVSKQALEKFTTGLAEDLIDRNIQVNCVSPSDTLSEAYQKYFSQYATEDQCVTPKQVAQIVLDFAYPESSTTGQIKVVSK